MTRGGPGGLDGDPFWPVPRDYELEPLDERERARLEAETVAAQRRRDVEGYGPFPHLGDGVIRRVNFVDHYGYLTALAVARVEYLGRILATEIAAAGFRPADVLVGSKYSVDQRSGDRVEVGEELRALVALEAQERDRAGKLLGDGVRIGVQIQQAEAVRAYADVVALAQQALLQELGLDSEDEAASRAAMRAVLIARRRQGFDDGDPDAVAGPPLTAAERRRLLSKAAS